MRHLKPVLKYTFEGEHNKLESKVNTLGRNVRVIAKLDNVNTTGLSYPFSSVSNIAIDNLVAPQLEVSASELNGIQIYDEENELCYVRINGNWKRISLGDSGWIKAELKNSWVGRTFQEIEYRKQGNEIRLRGTFSGIGASGSEALLLPEFFRPTDQYDGVGYKETSGGEWGSCYVRVLKTGSVAIFYNGSPTFLSVSNTNFTND
jgi:hypothetical protein